MTTLSGSRGRHGPLATGLSARDAFAPPAPRVESSSLSFLVNGTFPCRSEPETPLHADLHLFIKDFIGASGSSAVGIDNKIEQAMDLVKSHLMFAVREEVEVLKEKIAELMDRITQLELENSILKAHATQETLAQLTNGATQLQNSQSLQQLQLPQAAGQPDGSS